MILYHFSAREYLEVIARDGLSKGEIPITRSEVDNAVWLTNDRDQGGHGLTEGRELTAKEKHLKGIHPDTPARFPDKRAIRYTLKIPSADRKLVHWPKWGRKRLAPDWYDVLARTGGNKDRTWWLYFGLVPAEAFLEVFDLRAGEVLNWKPEW